MCQARDPSLRYAVNAMRVGALITVLLAAGVCSALRAADLPATLERVRPSVVAVGTLLPTRSPPGRFVGTGFAVADGRHAITNAHNLPDALDAAKREVLAVFSGRGKGRVRGARLLGQDRVHDLALLAFDGEPLPALAIGDSARVREGEIYAFTGFPIGMVLGLYPATHRGIVSVISPIAIPQLSSRGLDPGMIRRLREPYEVFQLDATAYPGNSGSPLWHPETGEVVGVVNRVFVKETKEKVLSDPSGISYAIPAVHVRALLREHGLAP